MILAGDVGGTKVHLALYDFTSGNCIRSVIRNFLPISS